MIHYTKTISKTTYNSKEQFAESSVVELHSLKYMTMHNSGAQDKLKQQNKPMYQEQQSYTQTLHFHIIH